MALQYISCHLLSSDFLPLLIGDINGPVFTNCPANKTEWISPGKTSFVIRLDDIELENPDDSIVMNPADLGSGFLELYRGPNHISIQAEDGAGNTAWCNFTVTVQGRVCYYYIFCKKEELNRGGVERGKGRGGDGRGRGRGIDLVYLQHRLFKRSSLNQGH